MTCQSTREIFPELLDHRTPATAHLEARAHLAHCPDCQREFAALMQTATALDALTVPPPSPRLRQSFYAMLEEEKHSAASVQAATARQERARRNALWRWVVSPLAGCTLLAVAFYAGQRSAPVPVVDVATTEKIADLQRKVDTMGQLVGYSLLQQQQRPTNDRLLGVLAAAQAEQPSAKVLDNLIGAVAFDPSSHVRLRALEALYPHADREVVRAGILAALPREQDPLVQLELIEFVAGNQDREAAPALEKLSQSEETNGSVRDAAQRALARL